MEIAPIWQLDWDESLSVHIPEVDSEHRQFIGLINGLNQSIIERHGMEEIKSRLQSILDDTAAHFAHEEALFKEWGYPDAEEHAKKYVQVTQALREIMEDFELSRTEYGLIDAGMKVKKALIEHILVEDMKYRDYHCASGDRSKGERCQPSLSIPQYSNLCVRVAP